MKAVSKGLAKLDPLPTEPRPPFLPQHMLAIGTQCDLTSSEAYRVGWEFSLTCWSGCNRQGDILASAERARKPVSEYDPFFHTHRGRVGVKHLGDGRMSISFSMIPPKQNPLGKYDHQSVFVTGPTRDLLNCGNELADMLLKDPAGAKADLTTIPLFRLPQTGREILKIWHTKCLDGKLKSAALDEFVGKGHSLRIGGATLLFEMHGEAAVRALGGWASAAMFNYLHLSAEKRIKYAEDMGRADAVFVPGNHLPIGRRR